MVRFLTNLLDSLLQLSIGLGYTNLAHFWLLGFTLLILTADGRTLAPIYWNRTNEIFRADNNLNVLDVNLGDSVTFLCPNYDKHVDPNLLEYYVIHRVEQTQYDQCSTEDAVGLVINCSRPVGAQAFFKLSIMGLSPNPTQPDFRVGKSYYFISTSTGDIAGLNNRLYGACSMYNMRLVLRVHNHSTTNPSSAMPTVSQTTKPRGRLHTYFTQLSSPKYSSSSPVANTVTTRSMSRGKKPRDVSSSTTPLSSSAATTAPQCNMQITFSLSLCFFFLLRVSDYVSVR